MNSPLLKAHLFALDGTPLDQWQDILRTNFFDLDSLALFLELNEAQKKSLLKRPRFRLNVPRRLAEKMAKGTLADPILRQFVPLVEELVDSEGFESDPVGDQKVRLGHKLLQKYQSRVLVVATGACAMHCRYCFRQHFDYGQGLEELYRDLEQVQNDETIHEVILSGGDPLSLGHNSLARLLAAIESLPHVRRIRFHTRFPMGIPERIDTPFLQLIEKTRQQIYFVIHANHLREFDDEVWHALDSVRRAGAILLNQSVLLRGVNDDVSTLIELCEGLADHGILPYYIHQLDRVQGAAHFEVSEAEGQRLLQEVAKQVSGYALPRYVKELSGEASKTII